MLMLIRLSVYRYSYDDSVSSQLTKRLCWEIRLTIFHVLSHSISCRIQSYRADCQQGKLLRVCYLQNYSCLSSSYVAISLYQVDKNITHCSLLLNTRHKPRKNLGMHIDLWGPKWNVCCIFYFFIFESTNHL